MHLHNKDIQIKEARNKISIFMFYYWSIFHNAFT